VSSPEKNARGGGGPTSPNRTPVKLKTQSKTCKWVESELLGLASTYDKGGDRVCDPRDLTMKVSKIR